MPIGDLFKRLTGVQPRDPEEGPGPLDVARSLANKAGLMTGELVTIGLMEGPRAVAAQLSFRLYDLGHRTGVALQHAARQFAREMILDNRGNLPGADQVAEFSGNDLLALSDWTNQKMEVVIGRIVAKFVADVGSQPNKEHEVLLFKGLKIVYSPQVPFTTFAIGDDKTPTTEYKPVFKLVTGDVSGLMTETSRRNWVKVVARIDEIFTPSLKRNIDSLMERQAAESISGEVDSEIKRIAGYKKQVTLAQSFKEAAAEAYYYYLDQVNSANLELYHTPAVQSYLQLSEEAQGAASQTLYVQHLKAAVAVNQQIFDEIVPLFEMLRTSDDIDFLLHAVRELHDLKKHGLQPLLFAGGMWEEMATDNEPLDLKYIVPQTQLAGLIQRAEFKNAPQAREKGVVITIRVDSNVQNLKLNKANGDFLERAVSELVKNSIKYHNSKLPFGQRQVVIIVAKEGDQIKIKVTDNGMGMDETDLKNLGTPGWRSPRVAGIEADKSSGIGLAGLKNKVETAYEGSFSVESVVGRGTSITILIPKKNLLVARSRKPEAERPWYSASPDFNLWVKTVLKRPELLIRNGTGNGNGAAPASHALLTQGAQVLAFPEISMGHVDLVQHNGAVLALQRQPLDEDEVENEAVGKRQNFWNQMPKWRELMEAARNQAQSRPFPNQQEWLEKYNFLLHGASAVELVALINDVRAFTPEGFNEALAQKYFGGHNPLAAPVDAKGKPFRYGAYPSNAAPLFRGNTGVYIPPQVPVGH